jgi:acyl-CoA thioester hydrolase
VRGARTRGVGGRAGQGGAAGGARQAEGYTLRVPIEVRFRDVDMMGHVNNAVYFTYFEVARTHYWKALGRRHFGRAMDFVLARAECDFRSPVTLEDDLSCAIRVASFGRRSFVFEYLLRDEKTGRLVAEGRSVQAMYDYERRCVRPLDEKAKEAIRRLEGRPIGTAGSPGTDS